MCGEMCPDNFLALNELGRNTLMEIEQAEGKKRQASD